MVESRLKGSHFFIFFLELEFFFFFVNCLRSGSKFTDGMGARLPLVCFFKGQIAEIMTGINYARCTLYVA